jgi:hypothetical protein
VLVNEMEAEDVVVLDAALSAECRDQRLASAKITPPAAKREPSTFGYGAARGTLAGVLLGAALWATILIPIVRR